MRKLGQLALEFLWREDCPTAVEYAVMLALIVIVSITSINANNTFAKVGSSIKATGS